MQGYPELPRTTWQPAAAARHRQTPPDARRSFGRLPWPCSVWCDPIHPVLLSLPSAAVCQRSGPPTWNLGCHARPAHSRPHLQAGQSLSLSSLSSPTRRPLSSRAVSIAPRLQLSPDSAEACLCLLARPRQEDASSQRIHSVDHAAPPSMVSAMPRSASTVNLLAAMTDSLATDTTTTTTTAPGCAWLRPTARAPCASVRCPLIPRLPAFQVGHVGSRSVCHPGRDGQPLGGNQSFRFPTSLA